MDRLSYKIRLDKMVASTSGSFRTLVRNTGELTRFASKGLSIPALQGAAHFRAQEFFGLAC